MMMMVIEKENVVRRKMSKKEDVLQRKLSLQQILMGHPALLLVVEMMGFVRKESAEKKRTEMMVIVAIAGSQIQSTLRSMVP